MKETFWICNVCSPARCYLKSIGLATPTECVMSLNGIPRWESEQQASKSVEAQNSTSPNTTKGETVRCCADCQYVWPECGAKNMGCGMFSPRTASPVCQRCDAICKTQLNIAARKSNKERN